MFTVQLLALIILSLLLLAPKQSANPFITELIIASSLLLLPVFAVNVWRDIKRLRITTIFFILFLLAGALSVVNSIDRQASITQLVLYISYFIIFTSIRSIFASHKSKELMASGLLLVASVLSVISLYNTLVLRYVNYDGSTSFMWLYFSHNHLSALLIFAIPMTFYLFLRFLHRPRSPSATSEVFFTNVGKSCLLFSIFFLLFSLFLTLGRGSMLSLFIASSVGLLFAPALSPRQKTPRQTRLAAAVLIACFLFIVFALPFGLGLKNFPVAKGRVDIANQETNRPLYWRWAMRNFSFHPYFGTGLDTYGKVSKVSSFLERSTALRSEHVHNFFLQMASDAGIFGLLTSVGLIGSVLWEGLKNLLANGKWKINDRWKMPALSEAEGIDGKYFQLALLVGIFASTLNAFVDYDWQLPTVFLIFWILAGLIASQGETLRG